MHKHVLALSLHLQFLEWTVLPDQRCNVRQKSKVVLTRAFSKEEHSREMHGLLPAAEWFWLNKYFHV